MGNNDDITLSNMGGRDKSFKVLIMLSRDIAKTKFHFKDLLWYTLYHLIEIVIKNNDNAVNIKWWQCTTNYKIIGTQKKTMTSFYFRAQRMFSPIEYHIMRGTNKYHKQRPCHPMAKLSCLLIFLVMKRKYSAWIFMQKCMALSFKLW